jgi:hypothetical protein
LCPTPLRPPDLRSIISCSPVMSRFCFTAESEKWFHWFQPQLPGSCRWSDSHGLGFGHFEADECGSMNEWLAAAPAAQLAHGVVGCRVSVSDMADREPRLLSDGEVIDIGGKRFRYIDTPQASRRPS